MSIYSEIIDTARYDIEDGSRDLEQIFSDAYYSELNRYTENKWELIRDTFTPDELLDMIGEEYDVRTKLWDHAYSECASDIQQLLDDHVWTIYYCDGPNESDWRNYDEVYSADEFADMMDDLVGDGWLLISVYDKEAYLEDIEEDE